MQRRKIAEIYGAAANFFHENLKRKEAQEYIKERRIDASSIEKFCIGFSPEGNGLIENLKNLA